MPAITHNALRRHLFEIPKRVTALAVALFLSVGCSTIGLGDESADDGSMKRPLIERPQDEPEDMARARSQNELDAAQRAWTEGDALETLAITTRALRDGVLPEFEVALRELRSLARAALVDERVMRIYVVPAVDAVADGGSVAIDIRIRNVGAAPLTIVAQEQDSSNALVVLEVQRDDYDLYGSVRTTETSVRVPIERDITLAPGVEGTVRSEIPGDATRLTHTGFSTMTVGGRLRPVAIRVGASEFFDAVPVETAIVRVFMKGFEPLAEDPLASLASAIRKRSPPHVLTSAELLAPDERATGIQLLRDAIENDPPLAFVLESAIKRLEQLSAL